MVRNVIVNVNDGPVKKNGCCGCIATAVICLVLLLVAVPFFAGWIESVRPTDKQTNKTSTTQKSTQNPSSTKMK